MRQADGRDDAGCYPCVCCGYLVLADPPNSHQICPICGWEDDVSQLRWPTTSGANRPSLITAQQHCLSTGVSEPGLVGTGRRPSPTELREPGWRRIDPGLDPFEPAGVQERPWPADRTVLYWWRDTYWRRNPRSADGSP